MRDRNTRTAIAMAGELGFGIAGPFVVCTGLGWWLDGQLGTRPWLVLTGLGIGLISTVGTFYRLATAFPTGSTQKKPGTGPTPPDQSDETPGG